MRGLKILVVVMGVLILGGTVTLVALLVQRVGGAGSGGGRPWETVLAQPDGARIGGIAAVEGGVTIWVVRPDGDRVLLLDPRGGRVRGEVRLR